MITSLVRWSILFIVLITCFYPQWISANPLDDVSDDNMLSSSFIDYPKRLNEETARWSRRDVWSRLFGFDGPPPRSSHQHVSNHLVPNSAVSRIRIIPFDKRTIPIELQKALYAHGIVGRRR